MSPPGWRARLVFALIGFAAVLVAAWRYIPEFGTAARIVAGDAKEEAVRRW